MGVSALLNVNSMTQFAMMTICFLNADSVSAIASEDGWKESFRPTVEVKALSRVEYRIQHIVNVGISL